MGDRKREEEGGRGRERARGREEREEFKFESCKCFPCCTLTFLSCLEHAHTCIHLGELELLGIIHIVDSDLAVGQEVVALDLAGQQKLT